MILKSKLLTNLQSIYPRTDNIGVRLLYRGNGTDQVTSTASKHLWTSKSISLRVNEDITKYIMVT